MAVLLYFTKLTVAAVRNPTFVLFLTSIFSAFPEMLDQGVKH